MAQGARNSSATIRTPVVKATFIGRDGSETSNIVTSSKETENIFKSKGAISPPLDPEVLCQLHEMSGSLRTNIDAYSTNIDAFGHTLNPVLDENDEGLEEKIKEALFVEGVLAIEAGDDEEAQAAAFDSVKDPSDAEVQERIKKIEREAMRERIRAEQFFDFCCIEESFIDLRMKTRQDLEIIGNAYWEILRNQAGEIVSFVYAPAHTIRLMQQDNERVEIEMPVRRTFITHDREPVQRRFRRFIQVLDKGQTVVYFKEFGDPRAISSKTGKPYKDVKALERKEPGVEPATELFHFKIHSPRTPYGVPRWVSELVSVLGTRHAQEVNMLYFENKSIPPMAILVSGGRLSERATKKISSHIENEIKGKQNYHKIMVLEAEGKNIGANNSGQVKIEIKPLIGAQQTDAQFLEYMQRNQDMIGQVFRMPRLLRGDTADFNRATAMVALEFSEQQVFGPLRNSFDWQINRKILPELGVRFWLFKSKGPDFTDPNDVINALEKAAKAGFLTPEELRKVAERVFGIDFKKIDADWVKQPLQLTLAGIPFEDPDDPFAGELDVEEPAPAPQKPGADSEEEEDVEEGPAEQAKRGRRMRTRRAARWANNMMMLREEFEVRSRLKDLQDFYDAHSRLSQTEDR